METKAGMERNDGLRLFFRHSTSFLSGFCRGVPAKCNFTIAALTVLRYNYDYEHNSRYDLPLFVGQ
jgi:hypothetical protein